MSFSKTFSELASQGVSAAEFDVLDGGITSLGTVATGSIGSAVTGYTGIKEADTWRLTTSFTNTKSPITDNWERDDTRGNGLLGTGMTLEGLSGTTSNGIFTFPSTGFWKVDFHARSYLDGDSHYNNYAIQVSVDNGSNWSEAAYGSNHINNAGANQVAGAHATKIFKVTSITGGTTFKVKFVAEVQNASTGTFGDQNANITYVTFIRLGDA